MDYDVIIVGAGVVGLACAAELSLRKMSIAVLERNRSFGMETSSRNSEVIHAGIYYEKNSLKAMLCVSGNRSLYEWSLKHRVSHNKIGKYIIAVDKNEEDDLELLYKKGKDNGVEGLSRISAGELSCREGNVRAVAALWSPDTGIIDSHGLMCSLHEASFEQGCDYAWKHEVIGIEKIADGYNLRVIGPDGEEFVISSAIVINSAGLDSDTIAGLTGIDIDEESYRLNYCRGHYFRISPSKSNLVSHLVYPVPSKNQVGLGIHVTIDLAGQLKLGPDTMYLKERKQDYGIPAELHEKFYRAASKYLVGIDYDDISLDQAGIRPKLQSSAGEFRDFIIREESDKGLPGFINLVGIESPGLTSCLEIARLVSSML